MQISKADILHCKKINKRFGKNYFFATAFFPKELRESTYILYAFFRVPDEIVDNATQEKEEKLNAWILDWKQTFKGGLTQNPVLRATAAIHHKYKIPFKYSEIFLEAMKMDLSKKRYKNYQELCRYMDGSASAVGIMMSYIIGFKDKKALQYASDLGYTMQLTNFLRDIREDIDERDRIYLPLDELSQFKIKESEIVHHQFSPNFKKLMIFQIKRARKLYRQAEKGIPLLEKRGQRAVRLALHIYEAILDELEDQEKNPFIGKAKTSLFKKIRIAKKVW